MDFLGDILGIITGLTGLGILISMLVNVLKMFGLIKDGTSDKVVKIFDVLVFVAVTVVYFMKFEVNWQEVDAYIILAGHFIGLIAQIGSSGVAYKALKGTPVIGYSFDNQPKG